MPEKSGLCGPRAEWRCRRAGTLGVAVLGAAGEPVGYRGERHISVSNFGIARGL